MRGERGEGRKVSTGVRVYKGQISSHWTRCEDESEVNRIPFGIPSHAVTTLGSSLNTAAQNGLLQDFAQGEANRQFQHAISSKGALGQNSTTG